MEIEQILDQIYPLPETSKWKLQSCVTEVKYPKGHILLRADKIETTIYFIRKGIARAYSNRDGNEVTFWFGKEGDTVLSMKSYVVNQKGYEDIELLEDCELFELKSEKLQQLFQEDIHIANWGRKFAEKELVKTEERLISRQFRTATERYTELLTDYPHLIQRVQLGHIASYLGISQVSLSRIRADIK
ncbi:Crp/Fnr family transcriptional regulator [Flavobacterium sp.]|uniref:Crp/Fnr family transcriptional regulator n=1 Tax=Flavobacterium sp. TaxID=239 RepID=UPI003D0AC793